MRMRNKPWALDYLKEHADIVDIDMTHAKNIKGFFNDEAMLHVEVGTGMGRFITNIAKEHPDINFVGVEIDKNIIIRAVEKVIAEELHNVRLVLLDARHLEDYFNPWEIGRLYLNFSDPWPKNRHEKRRLTHPSFLSLYEELLFTDGDVHFKTDKRGFFEYTLGSMNRYGMSFKDINLDVHDDEPDDNVRTEYEEKFSSRGSLIRRVKASFN